MVASFIILLLAIIQSEWYQHRNKPFSVVGQVIAKTKRNNPVDVQLNIQVKEQRYCHPSNLRMVLSLDFINTGKDRLIFFKDGHFTAAYTLSRTMEDALAKKYELDVSQFGSKSFLTKDFHDISPLIDTLTPSDDYFIVVVPGEVYRSEESLNIPLVVNASTKQPDLPEGEHFLKVTLETWPDIAASPDKLRERWKEYGYLYSATITSLPVSFTFLNSNPEPCSR